MIDYEFLKVLRGRDDIELIVPEPSRIQAVKERMKAINEEVLKERLRIKTLEKTNLEDLFVKQKEQAKKDEAKKTKIRALPSIKSSDPCPEGFIRSTRTGKCIKDKKYKEKKARKVNVDNSILKILKEIKK